MSVYLVKDVNSHLDLQSYKEDVYGQMDLDSDYGSFEKFPIDDKQIKGTKRSSICIFYQYETYVPSDMFISVNVEPIESFLDGRKETNLKLILNVKFENGSNIYCRMSLKRNDGGTPKWYFENTVAVEIPKTQIFSVEKTYAARVSVEIIDKGEFDFVTNSFNKRKPMLASFLTEKRFCDFTIIAENGAEIRCHKVFLGGGSPVLDKMLLPTDCIETKENRLKINASEAGIKALLDFIYCGKLGAALESPVMALELMELAHKYAIGDLEKCMQQLFLKRADEWMDMDAGLNLYLQSVNKDGDEYKRLKEKGIRLLKVQVFFQNNSHQESLHESSAFQNHLINTKNLLKYLLQP